MARNPNFPALAAAWGANGTQVASPAALTQAVRAALGNPQFDLVGVSYGTRVAQQYLMRHPDGVRSVVLDSVAPNELALGEDFSDFGHEARRDIVAIEGVGHVGGKKADL